MDESNEIIVAPCYLWGKVFCQNCGYTWEENHKCPKGWDL